MENKKQRIAKYVTKELPITRAEVGVFKDGKAVKGVATFDGKLTQSDLLGRTVDDSIIVQVDKIEHSVQAYRMLVGDFIKAAEPYEKDRRNTPDKKEEKEIK